MAKLEEYASKYENIRMERRDGIVQITFHTNGGSMIWGVAPHRDFGYAFADIGSDPENKVVVMTGAGDDFCADLYYPMPKSRTPSGYWETLNWEGKQMLTNLLNIDMPIIAAVNGPVTIHSEVPLLSDIVLASETATFKDAPHFPDGIVPGDGVHVVFPLLMGPNRGRYFLLTGQTISAQEALKYGLVSEVLPKNKLLPRAWELAEWLMKRPTLTLRYSRIALIQQVKRLMLDNLGYGLALEGLGVVDIAREQTTFKRDAS